MVALELALEFGDPDLEARARADRGLALINQGRIAEGFDQLDQAMAAIVAGTVSPLLSGTIFCAMLSACERTGDLKPGEAVLIATGSRPFHPPGIPFDDPDVFDCERVLEIGSAPPSVVIVGGGAIG